MTGEAEVLIRQQDRFEPEIEIIPNQEAVRLLKEIYLSGKNRNNPHARCPDISRGKDYVRFRLPLNRINGVDQPKEGIIDHTVNVDYAKTLIGKTLPPILIGRKLCVIDGGHRY